MSPLGLSSALLAGLCFWWLCSWSPVPSLNTPFVSTALLRNGRGLTIPETQVGVPIRCQLPASASALSSLRLHLTPTLSTAVPFLSTTLCLLSSLCS